MALSSYPYLVLSVAYAVLVTALAYWTLPRAHFALTMLAGLIQAPAGVFLYYLEGNYWNPVRVAGGPVGVEDPIISFAVGAMGWYMVALVLGRRLHFRYRFRRSLVRYVVAALACDIGFLIGVWIGLDGMTALLAVCLVATLVFWWLQPWSWRVAAIGAPVFGVTWFLVVLVSLRLWPGYLYQWNLDGPWGMPVLGVPVGETAWAAVFGAFWPLFIVHVFEVAPARAGGYSGNRVRPVPSAPDG